MLQGTSLQSFTQLGSTVVGTPMGLLMEAPDNYTPRTNFAPRGPLARLQNRNTPLDRIIQTQFSLEPNYDDLVEQYSSFAGGLSERIRNKARRFGVLHILGKHKYQSSFAGGVDTEFNDLTPAEIIAYSDFYDSLTPTEQEEFSNFLGLDKIGKAIGNAAKAVGKGVAKGATAVAKGVAKGATAAAKGVRNVAVASAKGVRNVAHGVAHVSRDVAVTAAKGARTVSKFTWKNLPYVAAIAATIIGGPAAGAAVLSAIAAMKASGASDQQINDYLDQQTGGAWSQNGSYDTGADPYGYEDPGAYDQGYPDFGSADESDISPDASGNIQFPDGSVYNVNTKLLTTPDGKTVYSELDNPVAEKKTDWLMWGAVAAVVILVGYYLHKKGAFKNFKFK